MRTEHPLKAYLTAGTIISSLGATTEENMRHIRAYRSGIRLLDDPALYEAPFMGARIERDEREGEADALSGYTRLERLFIASLSGVIDRSGIDPTGADCLLILSTTKGNIDRLSADAPREAILLSPMAQKVADYFHLSHPPLVVSTACISGVSALIAAYRLVMEGRYRRVLVAGGDLLTRFVATGFQSFKSIGAERCRPYDKRRDGLSLGEASGAVLVTAERDDVRDHLPIVIEGGAVTNDAHHISAPSRTGEGLRAAVLQAMGEAGVQPGDISFVNAHGTATVYNDEMESKAFHLSGLDALPLNSLKPFWGHTLGASGVIETVACMEELCSGEVFGTLGFEAAGTTYPLNLSDRHRSMPLRRCLKTASGFGGCNAAIVLALEAEAKPHVKLPHVKLPPLQAHLIRRCTVERGRVVRDGTIIFHATGGEAFPSFIREAYAHLALDDRRFYKMDDLCKLGYIAAAYLLSGIDWASRYKPEETGIILSNASSSLDTDIRHQQVIEALGDKEASPAVFVYTLPNVVMGELCIRYNIRGENTFFITPAYDPELIKRYALLAMKRQKLQACLAGWCEYLDGHYCAQLEWIERIK
ncbi:MAG: beta-ACP synthase [Tannerellaceae bacterium]|jgi:3-oxoacyl-(acyl-carrier-protein) synthase|nr:beta-ACP synthase [Tannerellaceae bacterium]